MKSINRLLFPLPQLVAATGYGCSNLLYPQLLNQTPEAWARKAILKMEINHKTKYLEAENASK